jgi:hypothetical protein
MLRGEMGRADSKASLLLALTGAALAGVASAAPELDLPTAAVTVGVLGIAALFTATVLLLVAVRPSLAGTGWPTWHRLESAELAARLDAGQHLDEIQVLQTAARRKFRRVQAAVDAILVGMGALATAAGLTALL